MMSRLAAAVVFSVVAGVVFWYALSHTVHLGTLSVPDLRGMEVTEAQRHTHDMGLKLELDQPGVFSAELEPGTIAAQDPHPAFHVKSGSTIRIRLSLGSERVAVPSLETESLQGALQALKQVGLQPGSQALIRGQTRGDSIVATHPPVGSTVPPGSEVRLLINLSPRDQLWVMPSLLSHSLAEVRRFCRQNHLRLGQVHEVDYPGLATTSVLRQYPPAGSPLARSDIITVWVSR
jgi:serine/threonine-protein kinase